MKKKVKEIEETGLSKTGLSKSIVFFCQPTVLHSNSLGGGKVLTNWLPTDKNKNSKIKKDEEEGRCGE